MTLSTLTASQLRLLEALAAHSRVILLGEREAADELLRRKLIERERRGSAIMRPTLAAMRALYLRERAAKLAAECALPSSFFLCLHGDDPVIPCATYYATVEVPGDAP